MGETVKDYWRASAMIATGGVSGGVGSVLAGGNFWDGVRNGLISSTLNHAAHMIIKKIEIEKIIKKYEANEIRMIDNTIKLDALLNFTDLGQLKK